MPPLKRRLSHEQTIFVYALLAGLPATIVSMAYLWGGDESAKVSGTLTLLIASSGWASRSRCKTASSVRSRPWRTCSPRCARGFRHSRARRAPRRAARDVMAEINTLSRTLQEQRLSALEATALLRTVMEEINIAIFAFDGERKLRLANHAAQLLLAKPAERILGRDAAELGLAECLEGDAARLLRSHFRRRRALGHAPQRISRGRAARISLSSSRISAAPCARRSCSPGSASCACLATS